MDAAAVLTGEGPPAADLSLPYPLSVCTDDPFEARVRTQEFLGCSHRMTVLDRETPFRARVQYRSLNGLGLLTSEYGPALEIGCSPPIGLVTVSFVAGGQLLVADGRERAVADPAHAAVFCYNRDVTVRGTPGLRTLMLTIGKPRLARYLQNLLNEPVAGPVEFHPSAGLAGGSGQGIAAATASLRRALAACGKAGPPPVLAAELEHSILSALLLGHPHNYTGAIYREQALPAPRVVRRVVELIDSAPETAFTVADLAVCAGVSERSLHAAFRRQLGASPMSYVRARRLEQARQELLQLDPAGGARVTDVALRYGFAHTGRFAAAYRARFGELPSATLRR